MGRQPFQELPLLPGEYEFLRTRGWLSQFEPYELKVVEYDTGRHVFRAESIISKRPGCACDHATRTTICRLYPLLPVYALATGAVIANEALTIFEEIERLDNMPPACQLTALPFSQMDKFFNLAQLISTDAEHLLYLEAYRRTKQHVTGQLARAQQKSPAKSVLALFEIASLRGKLIDQAALNEDLNEVVEALAPRLSAMRLAA